MAGERGTLRRWGGAGAPGTGYKDEWDRLQALDGLRIAGTGPEPEFDAVAALAARLAGVQVAAITFVDGDREWVKAAHGRALPHVDRGVSLGERVITQNGPLAVEDAAADARLDSNPWVRGGLRFYAAVALRTGGLPIGTLAVLDPEPRRPAGDLPDALEEAAGLLVPHLQRRREEAMSENFTAVFDLEARFRRASLAFEQVLGWRPEEMVGRPLVDFIHPDDVEVESERIARILEGQQRAASGESRFRTRDGGYRWVYWTTQLAPHEGLYYSAGKDITDRKRDELSLRESEARYRLLAENASDMVTGHDLDGTMTYVSRAARTLIGWDADELVGRSLYEFVHPDDRATVEDAHERLLADNEPVRISARVRRRDGSWVWVEAISRLVRDGLSRPVGFQTATRDISETKAAVEALQSAREHFRRAFDDAPIGMAIARLDGRFERVNAALCEVLGYSEHELIDGPGPLGLIPPEDRAAAIDSVHQLIDGRRRTIAFEQRHLHKDGHTVWLRVTASVLRDAPDAEPRILEHIEDVTQRRRTADELHRAREEAERANRAKSEFLSRMSHELRTPLNAVLGFAQLLEADDLAASQRESVARILGGGYHLLNLVNDVLDLSAIESGQLPIPAERVCAVGAIEETVELMRPLADERAIRLRSEFPAQGIALRANEQRLKQVLLNLTSNAIKYSPRGAEVVVTVERTARGRARIHVTDTGSGIAADDLERIFAPFERLGAPRETEGTGLGLPLSRTLVEGMGGTLTVESSAAGSTFTVELPLDPAVGDAQADASQAAAGTEDDAARRRRVLYVEDNDANVALVERLCRRRGDVDLHTAARGDAGLELARRIRPDAVILDLHLPDTSADEVLRELCADQVTRDTPVIVVTADVTRDHERRLRAAGATAYLTKPLDLVRLQNELDRALAG